MPLVNAGEVELFYETFGDPADPAMLLIVGLGAQMTGWDAAFCKQLARKGLYVIRYDNRDIGLSTKFHDAPVPDPMVVASGDHSEVVYRLDDMAADAVHLLDALHIDVAHIAGSSMGGMIAQLVAIQYPERVLSLTSFMSTTGNPEVGQPHPEGLNALFSQPASDAAEDVIANMAATKRALQSPATRASDRQAYAGAKATYERSYYPDGARRQIAALLVGADRTEQLRALDVPALAIHGADDPLIDVSGGEATAAAIPGAELLVLAGTGHDMPGEKWLEMIEAIMRVVQKGQQRHSDR